MALYIMGELRARVDLANIAGTDEKGGNMVFEQLKKYGLETASMQ
ncbi:hypothetical protein VB005_03072, partial [Metarhizium brunneum]